MTYPLTFHTTRFIPQGSAGCVRVFLVPVIFIRPEYKNDKGLYAHELTHVKQAWRSIFPPIYAIRYLMDKSYRLKCEVEAYKKQLEFNPERRLTYAKFIAERYDLNISMTEAANLLT